MHAEVTQLSCNFIHCSARHYLLSRHSAVPENEVLATTTTEP